jgi:hypothetical protein
VDDVLRLAKMVLAHSLDGADLFEVEMDDLVRACAGWLQLQYGVAWHSVVWRSVARRRLVRCSVV